jgi:hypothetical protein
VPTTRRNPWVSLDASADPVDVSRRLQLAHSTVVGHDGRVPAGVRPVVLDSWRRTTRAGLRPEGHAPTVVIDESRVDEVRRAHPLAATLPAIHEAVGRVAHDAGHLLVVTDATGTLLWAEGHPAIKDAAWHLGFFEGARWSEDLVGTNAIGTALAIDHPVQILSGEHFVRTHHPWVCSGAPIHDPETGAQLGVIDLSGPLRTAHPMILGFVATAARMAEHLLAERMHERDRVLHEALLVALEDRAAGRSAVISPSGRVVASWPHGWLTGRVAPPSADGGATLLADGTTAELHPVRDGAGFLVRTGAAAAVAPPSRPEQPALTLLDGRPRITWAGRTVELGARHAEILALLAAHPAGLTGEELTRQLYGPGGNPITVRAEVSRLRRLLGALVRTRPYRLAPEIDADLGARLASIAAGAGADGTADRLLPRSTAPGVVALREVLAPGAGTDPSAVLAGGGAAPRPPRR